MANRFNENVKYLLKDLVKFNNEPSIILSLVRTFEDANVEDLEHDF